jgi:cell division protein FtsW
MQEENTIEKKGWAAYLEGDAKIWAWVMAMAAVSLLVVYSATGSLAFRRMEGNTEYYLVKHGVLLFLSLAVIWVCHKIDYRYYSRLSRFALILSVPMLVATWAFGSTINEATRWVTIPFINQTFQVSDLAKFALIANVASMLSKRQMSMDEFQRAVLPIFFWCAVICMLIALSDLSTSMMLLSTCLLVMFIGRTPLRYLFSLIAVGLAVVALALLVGQRGSTFVSRVDKFVSGTEVPFQAEQSYIAIATGGVMGKGPGNSTQRNILPHPYSDFIFSIIVEEYGLWGGSAVIFAYLFFLYRGLLAVRTSKQTFGGLLSAGLSFSLVIQAFVHICVAVGLVPITGMPLPMLSMGGTSLLFTGAAVGVVLSVSRGNTSQSFSKI